MTNPLSFPCSRILLLSVIFIVISIRISGQSVDETFISFETVNEELSLVLERISRQQNLNLTYNASDPVFGTRITYSAHKKDVITILSEILSSTHHELKQVGNHFVIVPAASTTHASAYQPESHNSNNYGSEKQEKTQNNLTSNPANPAPDTVVRYIEQHIFLRDTIWITDTIVFTEKEIIRDTIIIRQGPQRAAARPGRRLNSTDIFKSEADRRNDWALLFSYAHMAAGFQVISPSPLTPELKEVKDSEAFSFRNAGLGGAIQYNTGNFSFVGGISLNIFSSRFYYSEIFSSGGFTKTDTLDVFFTIVQTDTIWKYVTDTTWVPLNREEILFDRMNRIGLLEGSILAAYTFFSNNDLKLFTRAGLHGGIPVWLRGNTIVNEAGLNAEKLSRDYFVNYTFGYQAGLGASIKLSNFTDIHAEAFYKRYLDKTTPNHPLDRRLHGIGLMVGILYYF